MKQENPIADLTYEFALKSFEYRRQLIKLKNYYLADQLFRASTSVSANVQEALAAHTKKEFTMKMGIALKEAREANYWMRLCKDSGSIESESIESSLKNIKSIMNILGKIILTSRKNPDRTRKL